MEPVQLALIVLGLAAILGGMLALVAAIWTLRARTPQQRAPATYVPSEMDPAPTLDRTNAPRPAEAAPADAFGGAQGFAPVNLPGEVGEDDDEDEIPTTVLNASAFSDLDEMMAAIDDLDRRDPS